MVGGRRTGGKGQDSEGGAFIYSFGVPLAALRDGWDSQLVGADRC